MADPQDRSDDVRSRISDLRRQIEDANYRYHILDQPTISDSEYDQLLDQLRELERQHPELASAESPTATVAPPPSELFGRIAHIEPMLGLANAYDMDDLEAWDRRVRTLLDAQEVEYAAELKIDGLAMALRYKNGRLDSAATRGDGTVGEDVTANAQSIAAVPKAVHGAPDLVEIRCEVYMPLKGFYRLNKEREEQRLPAFANPRNAAAGAVRQQDPSVTASRPLDLFAFGVSNALALGFETQWEVLAKLQEWGLAVNPNNRPCRGLDEVRGFCATWQSERGNLPYEADGVVVKVNSLRQQEQLGSVFRSPRWAVAYKFPPLEATTAVKSIFMIVGREGSIIPYAAVDPVTVGGATLSVIPLHNEDYIERKDIRIGDRVIVRRAGDIRPQIVKSLPELRTGEERPFRWPSHCPACGSAIERKPSEAAWKCPDPECSGKLYQRIKQFVSQEAMDIRGIGDALAGQLVNSGRVKDVGDLYLLTQEELIPIGLTIRQAAAVVRAIERSKNRPLNRLIFGIGIADIGLGMATRLAKEFSSLEELGAASIEQLTAVQGVGRKTAEAIVGFFSDARNQRMLAKLGEAGVSPSNSVSRSE